MIFELVIYTVKNIAEKISYAVVDIVASTKSELSKISQVKFFSYSCGYSLTEKGSFIFLFVRFFGRNLGLKCT